MGHRYYLNNKKGFDAETYVILRALKIFGRGQESGRCYANLWI